MATKMPAILFHLPADQLQQLNALAKQTHIPRSQLIRLALAAFLKRPYARL